MEDNKFILVAIAVLVIVLGVALVLFTASDSTSHNAANATNNSLNVTKNPGNITAEVIKDNSNDVNKSSSADNSSPKASGNTSDAPEKAGWKWSEQLQTYTNEFVDSEGNLHIQLIGADGHVQELVYMTDGSIFSGGENITKQYHESFS